MSAKFLKRFEAMFLVNPEKGHIKSGWVWEFENVEDNNNKGDC